MVLAGKQAGDTGSDHGGIPMKGWALASAVLMWIYLIGSMEVGKLTFAVFFENLFGGHLQLPGNVVYWMFVLVYVIIVLSVTAYGLFGGNQAPRR